MHLCSQIWGFAWRLWCCTSETGRSCTKGIRLSFMNRDGGEESNIGSIRGRDGYAVLDIQRSNENISMTSIVALSELYFCHRRLHINFKTRKDTIAQFERPMPTFLTRGRPLSSWPEMLAL